MIGTASDADQRSAYETMEGDKRTALECGKRKYKASAPAECFGMNFAVYELLSRSTPGEHDRENLYKKNLAYS